MRRHLARSIGFAGQWSFTAPLGARLGSFLAFLDAGDDLVAGQIAVGLDGLAARVAGLHAERLRDFTRTHFAEQRDRDEPQPGTQTEPA